MQYKCPLMTNADLMTPAETLVALGLKSRTSLLQMRESGELLPAVSTATINLYRRTEVEAAKAARDLAAAS